MCASPTLTTQRLLLRPWHLDDAPELRERIDDPLVAATTLTIPHPYSLDDARGYIGSRPAAFERGEDVSFAITRRADGRIVGGISLDIETGPRRAEVGYWIAQEVWNQGFATEATAAVFDHAFRDLDLRRVTAYHKPGNDASARVMVKCGMQYEGVLRDWAVKDGISQDSVVYGITRGDWDELRGGAT